MNEREISGELEEPACSIRVFDEPSEDHLREDLAKLFQISTLLQVGLQD